MISPSAGEILAATVTALEDVVGPALQDEHAASTLRTATQMLRSVGARLEQEQRALAEDNAELRSLLMQWRDRIADPAPLAPAPEPRYPTLEALVEEAHHLRTSLVAAIDAVPQASDPFRVAAREYLRRSLERQEPWLVKAFTGPRR